jgi:hypothetical protein
MSFAIFSGPGAQPAVGPERTPPNSVDEADLMRGGGGHKLAGARAGIPCPAWVSEAAAGAPGQISLISRVRQPVPNSATTVVHPLAR